MLCPWFIALTCAWPVLIGISALGAAGCFTSDFARWGSAAVYLAGSLVCHQQPDRSFSLAGAPLAVCARCTGIYVGACFGALVAFARGRIPLTASASVDWNAAARWKVGLMAAALPTMATAAAEWTSLAHPPHAARAIAGAPLGFGVACLLVAVLRGDMR